MNTKEYDQKKWECWATFKQQSECEGGCLMADAFFHAFDRAYALGKQERDAEGTTPNNRLKARRKSDGEIIEVREWRGASDVIYSSPDMNQFYQASELDFNVDAEETVIQGWVARDYDGDVFLYQNEPDRNEIAWNGYMMHSLPIDSFPDLTWESEPEPVEIIIKRKKEWIKN